MSNNRKAWHIFSWRVSAHPVLNITLKYKCLALNMRYRSIQSRPWRARPCSPTANHVMTSNKRYLIVGPGLLDLVKLFGSSISVHQVCLASWRPVLQFVSKGQYAHRKEDWECARDVKRTSHGCWWRQQFGLIKIDNQMDYGILPKAIYKSYQICIVPNFR